MAAVELDLRDQGRPTYPKEKSDADTILGRPASVRSTAEGAGVKDPAGRPQPPQMMPS